MTRVITSSRVPGTQSAPRAIMILKESGTNDTYQDVNKHPQQYEFFPERSSANEVGICNEFTELL